MTIHVDRPLAAAAALALLVAPGTGAGATAPYPLSHGAQRSRTLPPVRRPVGLGKILATEDGVQVAGFGLDQHGDDAILTTFETLETFDQTTGTITRTFGKLTGNRSYDGFKGIFAGDVGLVGIDVVPEHSIYATRYYGLIDPVSGEKFTGPWTPPVKDFEVEEAGDNQNTPTSVLYGIELKNQDVPDLIVSDVARNSFGNLIHLDPNQFSLANSAQLAQDTVHNRAVLATSLDGGAVGGPPPTIAFVDLATGNVTEFPGVNCPAPYGCGDPNGLAYDSNTQIACTTTEVDGGVEFYDFTTHGGFNEPLPNGGGEGVAGGMVVNDPVNRLFLIAQPISSTGPGSSIQVYSESGDLVESINGFEFPYGGEIAVNPSQRLGWASGPRENELQQFFY